jgi:ATP-dependent exoDNAse (exonuclease V) beta subunit
MYIVGVFKKEPKEPTKFLTQRNYGEPQKDVAPSRGIQETNIFTPFHHRTQKPLPVQTYEAIGQLEVKRGDVIHRILSLIEFYDDDVHAQIKAALERINAEVPVVFDQREIQSALFDFLGATDIRQYFARKEGRNVLREQELANTAGVLFRADRIIVDPAIVSLIDFKTGGGEQEAEYIVQVRNYIAIIKEIYPDKHVQGIIAYVDEKELKYIS